MHSELERIARRRNGSTLLCSHSCCLDLDAMPVINIDEKIKRDISTVGSVNDVGPQPRDAEDAKHGAFERQHKSRAAVRTAPPLRAHAARFVLCRFEWHTERCGSCCA